MILDERIREGDDVEEGEENDDDEEDKDDDEEEAQHDKEEVRRSDDNRNCVCKEDKEGGLMDIFLWGP